MNGHDDIVAAFQVEGAPVRGRYARLGDGTIDPILNRHDYPRAVALLLGEALTLAALIGSLLKVDGRLVVQAEGQGHISLLVAEHRSDGGLRGYARLSDGAAEALKGVNSLPPAALLGTGALAITLDQGMDTQRYQGVVALEGDTLAACAETYFTQSEQTPTRVRLAVAEEYCAGSRAAWRSGGALIQQVAGDLTRGDTEEGWARGEALFATLSDAELVDPGLSADRILYRLFHEDGVRMAEPERLADRCTCDRERLSAVLRRFSIAELSDMTEPDGLLHARCQFCSRVYLLAPGDVAAS